MFGSAVIETAIGVMFVYLVLSLICSAMSELVGRWLQLRQSNLREGIEHLLADKDFAAEFYKHPLIASLSRSENPSYIPSRTFATVVMELRARGVAVPQRVLDSFAVFEREANGEVDLQKRAQAIRKQVEQWFDDTMDRASGWYKRKLQTILWILGLLVAFATNADTIAMVTELSKDPELRAAVADLARETAERTDLEAEVTTQTLRDLAETANTSGLPMGWSLDALPSGLGGWLGKIVGLLVTGIALSLGAPFWFDILNKLVNLRGSGKRVERTSAEGSTA